MKPPSSTLNERSLDSGQRTREDRIFPSILLSTVEFVVVVTFVEEVILGARMPLTNRRGFGCALLTHALLVEPIYYWAHRLMHWRGVYKFMHKHHHLSVVPRPLTAVSFLWSEHVIYDVLFCLNMLIPSLMGHGSYALWCSWIAFALDLPNAFGHLNFEVLPAWWLDSPFFPFFYNVTYHHVHHAYVNYNYALFMPISASVARDEVREIQALPRRKGSREEDSRSSSFAGPSGT